MFSITSGLRRLGLCSRPTIQSLRFQSTIKSSDSIIQAYIPQLEQKRIIPVDNTYYDESPPHEKIMRDLNDLLRKYVTLPRDDSKVNKWLTFDQYQGLAKDPRLRPGNHRDLVKVLSRLNKIDSQLMPEEIETQLKKFARAQGQKEEVKVIRKLDEFGRSKTIGGRKAATAMVYMSKGSGEILVNGRPLNKEFKRLAEREEILYPLKVVESEGEYNIFITVEGGGFSGKAGAIANAIGKGLVIHNPLLKPRLYKAGCMSRDNRRKERKKPGKRKARKSPTWVKR
ncbi:40S ribosomal protein S9, mitochondrial [Wickerhamomyces ciferrii]|uniref:Small ribosomal subunit protein uS9m n=1 Tax=Wickerhamomyces ciferrii (strain ATCC 14091 / BCRC 22168 / CBS 111 / JCM 3599 / NBRC 0793 / NRRL Y-1031 F-60-10) TaxID=1206466 RepID=K0KCD2_WICCF|nr:40S ribosomal protein S9, mitochondrial [Wickerhamomyces ciferrii]CCH42735.1 40S ribosomal protein S9, mitochondrial [Wickerhamomyces ciferrii]